MRTVAMWLMLLSLVLFSVGCQKSEEVTPSSPEIEDTELGGEAEIEGEGEGEIEGEAEGEAEAEAEAEPEGEAEPEAEPEAEGEAEAEGES